MAGIVKRREDPRLIRGEACFTDDVRLPGCLHAVFVRSTLAHARITRVDVSEAVALADVVAVFVASDLEFHSDTARPRLCAEEVRFVGDAIAVVVAETREAAADAAAAVYVDYEPLAAIVDPVRALQPDAPLVDAGKGDNVAFEFEMGEEGALEGADVVVRARFVNQRLAPVPMEGNAVVAEPDGHGGMRMWVSTQVPFDVRTQVAEAIGVDEKKVHVMAKDVGGGFGAKQMVYPEPVVIGAVALKLGRPVRWAEHRSENMVAMTHGRGHVQDVALAARADGTLVGLEADVVADAGAYSGLAPPLLIFTTMLAPNVYELPRLRYRATSAFTNTAVMSSYRGAGRPEAIALIERAVDLLARELGMDALDFRRRNVYAGDFPHVSITGVTYDSGDFLRALELAADAARYDELRKEQAARRERGDVCQLGIGVCTYVEMTAVLATSEFGSARVEADGTIVVAAGTTASGQGHETAFAQLAAAMLDVPLESLRVVESDTREVLRGGGTYGSRSLQLGGTAIRKACVELVEKGRDEAARRLEAAPEDVEYRTGAFSVRGVPSASLSWSQLASHAELVAAGDFEQADQTCPFGCHIAVVEVDTETGEAKLLRHVAVDDCGTVLNQMLVEGQIHGGVAQGVAQALYEEFVYDAEGNPRTASLLDYGIPTIGEIPEITTVRMETPSPLNPLGAKGIGESGTIGSTPAVQNAVIDALSHLGVRHIDMPLHPMRVWEAIQKARG